MVKNLVPLDLPRPQLKLARKNDQAMVWDRLRKKYLVLTPEEWVRQHWMYFLAKTKEVPWTSMAVEGGLQLYKQTQRSDILVYKYQKPHLLVECKAPQVKISQKTLDQANRYNFSLGCSIIILSNGLKHWVLQFERETHAWQPSSHLPPFQEW